MCEALINTGIAGLPEEYFLPGNEPIWRERWGTSTYAEYLARTIEECTTSNGVFGVKMMWGYFDNFVSKVRQLPDYKDGQFPVHTLMQTVFPNLHYIWIKRRDVVRQAVSHAKARQTDVWAVKTERTPRPAHKPVFSFMQIDFMVQEIEAHEAAWQQYFAENDIQPLVVVYEDLVSSYEETALQALQYLGIPDIERVEFASRSLKKQADEESEQWVQRYQQLRSRQRGYRLLSHANRRLLALLLSTRPGLFSSKKRGH